MSTAAEVQPTQRRRRRQRIALLFFVGVVLHLVTDDNLVIMVSSSSMADDHQSHSYDSRQHSGSHGESEHRERRLPRGAAEALHDDALSQLPSLTSLQIGGLSSNHAIHSWDQGGDADMFLAWDSAATESHRRPRRARRSMNISKLLLSCKARNATTSSSTNVTTSATNNNNNATNQQLQNGENLEAIEELMDRAVTTPDRITNNSGPTSIITDDNTTPTTPIIVTEPPPVAATTSKQKDVIVASQSEQQPSALPQNTTSTNATDSSVVSKADGTTTVTVSKDDVSSSPTVEVDEEEDDEIGSVAVDYASKSAGAIILEKSHSFKGTSNLLNADRDRYAIAPCQDKKYVVIGLSEDILVKTVKLANYERYSSHLKTFSIWGSQTTKEWVDLGTYEARFGLGEQSFNIQPSWARYLKFKFLTHYGSEYYCTISQIKVHGRTMVQGFHEQWSESQEDHEEEEADEERAASANELPEDAVPHSESSGVGESKDSPSQVESIVRAAEGQVASRTPSESGRSIELPKENVEVEHGNLTTDDSDLENSNGTCDLFEMYPFEGYNDVLQSASFVLSSTSRMAQASPSHSIPDIAKGAFSRHKSVPATLSSHAQTLREAAARSIGNSPLLSAAVERIQEVATALGDSLDINVSSLGRLGRKSDAEKSGENVVDDPNTGSAGAGDVTADHKPEVQVNASPEIDASSDLNAEALHKTPVVSSSDADLTGESSKQSSKEQAQRHAGEESSSQDILQDLPPLVVHTLRRLPSADCLQNLNLGEFQAKMAATRKGGSKHAGASHAGNAIEPIFKTLTDQIRALQLTLSVHEQFTKSSVSCYQQVLADLALEMESIRAANDARMLKLERDIQELKATSIVMLVRDLALGTAVAIKFIAGLVAEIVVRAQLDVLLRMLWNRLEPSAVTTLVALLLLLAFLPLRPAKSTKSAKSAQGKSDLVQPAARLSVKVDSIPDLVDSATKAILKDCRQQDESFAVLAQDSTPCALRA